VSGGGRRGAATGRWRERVGEGGGWGGALTRLGPDTAAAVHIAIIEEEAEREREAALTWEREGMIQLLIFGPMGELYFKALD